MTPRNTCVRELFRVNNGRDGTGVASGSAPELHTSVKDAEPMIFQSTIPRGVQPFSVTA